ncbi:MAG: histidine kinase [Candidatus Sericytochromatia bacterium]
MTDSTSLGALHAVARALSSTVHLEQSLQITLSQVAELLQLETGWIFLLDAAGEPYLAAAQNLPPALVAEPERLCGSCYCLDRYRADSLQQAENISMIACSRLNQLQHGTAGLRFHASIPLHTGSQKLGVMNVASRERPALSPADLDTLYTVGDLLSLAIQRTRFYEDNLALTALGERYRMARELHDSLGQGLAALILRLDTLDALLEKGAPPEQLKPQLTASLGLARRTLREARGAVSELRSPEGQARPLRAALEQLVSELLPDLQVRLELPERQLSPALQHSVFRMAQELLTNIHRHAAARQVQLRLQVQADALQLQICDDGRGFDPEAIPPGHFGLLGLRERVHLLQGTVSLCSAPGQGTTIQIDLPGDFR